MRSREETLYVVYGMLILCASHVGALGRRFWQTHLRKGKCTEVVHEWEIEDQGECHERCEDRADIEKGTEQGQVVGAM